MSVAYKLYILPIGKNGIETATKERFSRITARYALVYTDKEVQEAVEVGEKEFGRLSDLEQSWIEECNVALIAEETEKKMPEIVAGVSEKLDAIERELKKEALLFEEEGESSLEGNINV